MNAFGFKYYFCLFLSVFMLSLTNLEFQTCHAFRFSIFIPKRKYLFKKIFNSEKIPVAGEFILRKKSAHGRPGEEIRFLVPLTAANTKFSLKASNPIRINNLMYSTKITPTNNGTACRFDFEQIESIPFIPSTKNPVRNHLKKQSHTKIAYKPLNLPRLNLSRPNPNPVHKISPSKLIPPTFVGIPQDSRNHPLSHPLYPSGLVPLPAPSSS